MPIQWSRRMDGRRARLEMRCADVFNSRLRASRGDSAGLDLLCLGTGRLVGFGPSAHAPAEASLARALDVNKGAALVAFPIHLDACVPNKKRTKRGYLDEGSSLLPRSCTRRVIVPEFLHRHQRYSTALSLHTSLYLELQSFALTLTPEPIFACLHFGLEDECRRSQRRAGRDGRAGW